MKKYSTIYERLELERHEARKAELIASWSWAIGWTLIFFAALFAVWF
jgi:hypothetical protein